MLKLLSLWHNRRRSILTGRQHLVGEAEYFLCELPLSSLTAANTDAQVDHLNCVLREVAERFKLRPSLPAPRDLAHV